MGELVGGDFFGCPEQDSLAGTGTLHESGGILRNLEESSGNTGIPLPQEFLQKISVKVAENRNF
jgi:hypothetical protein